MQDGFEICFTVCSILDSNIPESDCQKVNIRKKVVFILENEHRQVVDQFEKPKHLKQVFLNSMSLVLEAAILKICEQPSVILLYYFCKLEHPPHWKKIALYLGA